jgi:hypothetical protein
VIVKVDDRKIDTGFIRLLAGVTNAVEFRLICGFDYCFAWQFDVIK